MKAVVAAFNQEKALVGAFSVIVPSICGTTQYLCRKYNIYFFHLLINIEADRDSLKWILYKSSKLFLRFPGVFTERGSPRHWRISGTGDQRCTELGGDCVALETRFTSKYSFQKY